MSPKNKGKFGKGKPAVEPDDEFLSTMGKLGKKLEPHVKQIVIGVVIVGVVLVAFFGYRWWNQRQERNATTLYVKASILASVAIVPVDPIDELDPDADGADADGADKAPDATDGATDEAKDELKKDNVVFTPEDKNDDGLPDSYPTKADRAKAVLPMLNELRSEYGSTESGKSGRLLHATMLYDVGDFAGSAKMYKSYLSSSGPWQLKTVAREGLGAALEAQAMAIEDAGQRTAALDKALAAYTNIQRSEKKSGWERALYHRARVLAMQGKNEEARTLLQKALDDVPDSVMKNDIEDRLVQLKAAK